MKQVKDYPLTGQFSAVWVYDGNVWSGNYLWEDGELFEYDNHIDEWSIENCGVSRTAWGCDDLVYKTTKFFVVVNNAS